MQEILPHWLHKQAELAPNKIAIELEDGQQVTFVELKEKSQTFARQLATLGVKKGSRVAILSGNNLDMVIAIHALSYLQAIVVLLNTKLTPKELTEQLDESEAMLLLSTDDLQIEKQLAFLPQQTFTEVHELHETGITLEEVVHLGKPFTMMFTSGTTGKPKIVVHTYGNHWWSTMGSTLNLGLHANDKWLLTLPIYHVGGLSILLRSVITGMEVYLMKKYDAAHLLKALREKEITIASIVTVMLKDLMDQLQGKPLPQDVRCLLLGGGAVPAPLLKQVKEKALPLFQSYGMTETSSQIVTLSAEDTFNHIGSSGKPLFPAQVKIWQPDDTGIGEIAVKGPMVFNGYEKHPTANAEDFSDGWFKTGDIGYIDNNGFLFVLDRRTDLIISGGENIYPRIIENCLLEIDEVQEVAVVAKSDTRWGEVPVAFVMTKSKTLTEEKVIDNLQSKLASFMLPKKIYFIDQMPRNATNKIMRHRLKEQLT